MKNEVLRAHLIFFFNFYFLPAIVKVFAVINE